MEKKKMPPQLEEVSDEDARKAYDMFFDQAMHLLNDHQKPLELVAGTMIAIAQRLYRTQMNDQEYREMMEVVKNAPVEPYDVKKVRLH